MKKPGILLVNLGSPRSPRVAHVRQYLREFLMDKRVLDIPWPLRAFIVCGCILPFRPKKSAEAYEKIWTREGSPLVVMAEKVAERLRRRGPWAVEAAMRYQEPSPEAALDRLLETGANELLILPLFPHYAMSSFETAVERVRAAARRMGADIPLRVAPPYYNDPDYIAALAASARPHLENGFDHLLFSFHGLPERHLLKTDPTRSHCLTTPDCCQRPSPAHAACYRHQCFETARLFRLAADIPEERFSVSFQSRLGRDPWLRPYTDFEIARLAGQGIRRLAVACPSFVADCLETLEEVGMRGRDLFLEKGGAEFILLPCLNESPQWIDTLEKIARRQLLPQSETSSAALA